MTARQFTSSPAKRTRVPLFIGLAGPSGSGKTFSALRLATGIQRTAPGEIYVVDTEAGRALHYADQFQFQHVPFAAPFGAFDYLDAIRFCVDQRASTIVIDSASHMHEGQGGMLDQQSTLLDEWCGQDQQKRDKNAMRAWIQPKRELGRFVQCLLQLQTNVIFCFRAKEKIKPATPAPINLGMSAIADDSLIYEMTVQALLSAGCGGVPSWRSDLHNERLQTKLPRQFEQLLTRKGQPLDESAGELLGRWAAGDAAPRPTSAQPTRQPDRPAPAKPTSDKPAIETLRKAILAAATVAELTDLASANAGHDWTETERATMREAIRQRKGEL